MTNFIYPIAILNRWHLPTWLTFFKLKGTLPTAYQQVDYIEGNNTGYIPTDLYLEGSDTVKFTYRTPETGLTTCCIFGSYKSGEDNNFSLYSTGASAYSYWRYAGQLYTGASAGDGIKFVNDTVFKVEYSSESLIVNGTSRDTGFTAKTFTTNAFYIGHINASASPKLRGRIYSFEVVGKYKFIPCYKKDDNTVGMYEINTKTFYPAEGTLTAGNDE